MRRMYFLLSLVILFTSCIFATSQQSNLVRVPTAGLLENTNFNCKLELLPGSEFFLYTNVGLFNRLELGLSYGGQNILGYGKAEFYDNIGFNIKTRILDESTKYPAIAIGISTQGSGGYSEVDERYSFKSMGPYAVVSKNWWFLGGNTGLHGGLNYSLETEDEASVSLFFGFDKDINNIIGLNMEYDLSLADKKKIDKYGEGKGYMNASLWWNVSDNFRFEMLFLDLLGNYEGNSSFGRGVRAVYYDSF